MFSYVNDDAVLKKHSIDLDTRRYEQAANQGDTDAQCTLGLMYTEGDGVQQNYTIAAKWLEMAATQGNPDAQYAFGMMYFLGTSVSCDYDTAVWWFKQAAYQGLVNAQAFLGIMYHGGKGVPQDYSQSYIWLNLATAAGLDFSKLRDSCAKQLAPEQLSLTQKMATDLYKSKLGV